MIVYRLGPATAKNLTPRPGTDTAGEPGKSPGLSVWETVQLAPKQKAQVLDVTLLKPPLAAIPDDPAAGGDSGHLAIAPVDDSGQVDLDALNDWAGTRNTTPAHPFTAIVRDAITGEVKG